MIQPLYSAAVMTRLVAGRMEAIRMSFMLLHIWKATTVSVTVVRQFFRLSLVKAGDVHISNG